MFILIFTLSHKSFAQNSILINTDNNNQTEITIDLFRVCSHLSTNTPNHNLSITNNQINLTISIGRNLDASIPCDPLPPIINNYSTFNIGTLRSGEYFLNLMFVGNNANPDPSNARALFPFNQPFIFSIATLIPIVNRFGIILMILLIVYLTKRKINTL